MSVQEKVNKLADLTAYIQLMGSFEPSADFTMTKELVTSIFKFLTDSTPHELASKIDDLTSSIRKMADYFIESYPPKNTITEIAADFNSLFKDSEVYTYGLDFGWLKSRMELSKMKMYPDTPYHYKIGLGAHKGNGSIEEDFLLKDAYNIFVKAEYYYLILVEYGDILKQREQGKEVKFSQESYRQINDLKYEVAALSRLTIISIYAFIECFVNSVGHNHLCVNGNLLSEEDREILTGLKKGRYLQLKSKIERFPGIIRDDKQKPIVLSDKKQIREPFKSFFEYYEELRNASVHHSPTKEKIWLKPKDWLDKAKMFIELSMQVAQEFWQSCYITSEAPEYLGKLDTDLHMEKAKERRKRISKIELELSIES